VHAELGDRAAVFCSRRLHLARPHTRVKPLDSGPSKEAADQIVLTDVSGFLSEEGQSKPVIGAPTPRVGLLVRFGELKKAAEDSDVKALIVRINSPAAR